MLKWHGQRKQASLEIHPKDQQLLVGGLLRGKVRWAGSKTASSGCRRTCFSFVSNSGRLFLAKSLNPLDKGRMMGLICGALWEYLGDHLMQLCSPY